MKKLLIGILAFGSITAFSQNIKKSPLCKYRGQAEINKHIELVESGIENGDIDADLAMFFRDGIKNMQENLDYICKGIKISSTNELSPRERQLNLIIVGVASGEIDADLADFFLSRLKDFPNK